MLSATDKTQREALAKQLLTPSNDGSVMGCKKVNCGFMNNSLNGSINLADVIWSVYSCPSLHFP
jgi:hypothetical protein